MNNQVKVDFDPKTKKLKMVFPFFLADVARNFPARRFDPKSKTWRMPLTRANIKQLTDTKYVISYDITEAAQQAMEDYEKITALPRAIPFPYHVYDFTKSRSGFTPMLHQCRMLDRAWNLTAAAWFAKMGTGKTFATIHLACARFNAGLIDSLVIVCPSTLRATWRKEFAKYATVEYDFRVHETKAGWLKEFYGTKRPGVLQVLAVSVEGLGVSPTLYDSVCGFFPGRSVFLVADESSRIKNPSALRTERAIELACHGAYRLILNGTPIALGIQDLWSQYEFLDPNIIGTGDYWAFKTRYVTMGGYENKQIIGYQNVEELMKLIEPYTVEVGKDVLDLPPKVMKTITVQATPEQKRLLKLIKKGISEDPNDPLIKVENTLERVLRWRQVVGGFLPRQDPETEKVTVEPLRDNPKMDALIDLIEGNFAGTKFIIWAQFIPELEEIVARLTKKYGAAAVRLYAGSTSKEDRSAIEDAYCNDPSMRFFIANSATAGLGLTLISGENDLMVYYSGTSAYIDRAQSEDRSHRIGQKNSVTVVDLVMENTIDEVIQASISEKMSIEEYIMTRLAKGSGLNSMSLEG